MERKGFPDSTAVAAIAYEPERRLLDVTFTSGHVYRYFAVPRDVYDRFRSAESAGHFLHEEVLGRFRFERLSG